MEAASVLPLGISRAEVQSVFAHVRGCGTGTLPLSQLTAAAEAARNAGVPLEAAGQIDAKRLAPALQRLGTKASQQEFRVALMQAEPYMTHNQMEWLSELTDKDCEGRLLPPSLLPRLGIPGAVRTEPLSWNTVPPRQIAAKGAHSVAHSLPQVLVIACLMYRIRQRLFVGSQLTLGSLLGLFDIADGVQSPTGWVSSHQSWFAGQFARAPETFHLGVRSRRIACSNSSNCWKTLRWFWVCSSFDALWHGGPSWSTRDGDNGFGAAGGGKTASLEQSFLLHICGRFSWTAFRDRL